jgi:multidrug efflux pump subunit AcrA (membrane-fusion protein)
VAPVTARDVVYQVHALGSLEPSELVEITAEVSGAVKEVLLNAGDHVGTDTILVRVDPDRYRLEAARAEATHRRAVADWRRAESDLARREELAKDDLVAVEELIRARQESERLAADAAGTLRVVDLLGGYDRSPFDPATSPSMIWLLDRASV